MLSCPAQLENYRYWSCTNYGVLDRFYDVDHTNCSVKDFHVFQVPFGGSVVKFIKANHYSHNAHISGNPTAFSLMHKGEMIGAMIYGHAAMYGQWKSYADYGVEKESDLIELRRLVCIDDTPRNTESYFIGKTIRWMKRNTDYKVIVSYADPHHGHSGTIYKASNFKHIGMTQAGKIIDWNGRRYHDKSIRDYNRRIFRKTGERVLDRAAVKIKEALDRGEAKLVNTPPKHIYVYPLV